MPNVARHVPKLAVAVGLLLSAGAVSCAADSNETTSTPSTAPSGASSAESSAGGSSGGGSAGGSGGVADDTDFDATPADFVHLDDMTRVRNLFISNPLGQLDEAVAVAESPTGGVYPVGTIIQLVPQEAMVKRRAGFLPEFADWEFFELEATPEGTKIVKRGGSEVLNQFGLSCAACHAKADVAFDMVCESDHGCDPLPIGEDVFQLLRETDPRPRMTATGTGNGDDPVAGLDRGAG